MIGVSYVVHGARVVRVLRVLRHEINGASSTAAVIAAIVIAMMRRRATEDMRSPE
jgi:hypothetical protein